MFSEIINQAAISSENKTRIIKLVSLDGEYMLLGRQTLDTANVFIQYGFGATRTMNVTAGKGVQYAEFVDGLQISLMSEKEMGINVDLKSNVSNDVVPQRLRLLSEFATSSTLALFLVTHERDRLIFMGHKH